MNGLSRAVSCLGPERLKVPLFSQGEIGNLHETTNHRKQRESNVKNVEHLDGSV